MQNQVCLGFALIGKIPQYTFDNYSNIYFYGNLKVLHNINQFIIIIHYNIGYFYKKRFYEDRKNYFFNKSFIVYPGKYKIFSS